MKYILILLSFYFVIGSYAGEIEIYFQEYVKANKSNYNKEKQIVERYNQKDLTDKLTPFYNDSLIKIRQKAYYLTYKKGIQTENTNKSFAVNVLLKGCNDHNGGLIGQNLSYLQEFPVDAYDEEARKQIKKLLVKKQMPHQEKLILLAGYVKTGKEILHKKLLEQEISNKDRWILSLALARQGESEQLNYCLKTAKNVPLSNEMVSYFIPKLLYTRRKQAIDYCFELLKSNSKDCSTQDPDNPKNVVCGYFIMELLAPVIVDFPYQVDCTGSIDTDDYETALIKVQEWNNNNPEYSIKTNNF